MAIPFFNFLIVYRPVPCRGRIVVAPRQLQSPAAKLDVRGGIVADSTGEDEYMETRHKAGALMRAIDLAEGAE